jgi:DNA gyrase subunit A
VPELPLRSKGKHFANLIKLEEGEKVVSVLPVKEFSEGKFIISATAQGYVKKTELMAYDNIRTTGIIGLKLEDNDSLIGCAISNGKNDVVMATKQGKAIRFNEDEIRPMGRSARGVTGIRFGEEDDHVIGLEVIDAESTILTVCENGYGKRSPLDEYRQQTRGGKGIYTIKLSERNGLVVSIVQVADTDDVMLMTTGGKIVRFSVEELGVISRHTQGVRLINVDEGEKVIGVCKVIKFEGEEVG